MEHADLSACVRYALLHQPVVRQAVIDQSITEREIGSKIADWYPQVNFGFLLQHNPELPVSIVQGNPVHIGVKNVSGGQFSVTQTIFNKDVLLASSTADEVRSAAAERTVSTKIDVTVNVSKAYYAVLLSGERIDLLDEDIVRLSQSLADAWQQYKNGVVDKTDYERATIALNNAKAQRIQQAEVLKANLVALKTAMGYPPAARLSIEGDTTKMEREAMLDTAQTVVLQNRIEYQSLKTQERLLEANLDYSEWSFLPSVSAFGGYNLSYQSNDFSKLFSVDYPNSDFGIQLSIPIFEGGKRIQDILGAKLGLERIEYDFISLDNQVHTEFTASMAGYKSNLANYQALKQNVALAKDVYRTIQLQYKAGTRPYLDVITAETDLRTAQVDETDALYELLSSKLDVEKALGSIHTDETMKR